MVSCARRVEFISDHYQGSVKCASIMYYHSCQFTCEFFATSLHSIAIYSGPSHWPHPSSERGMVSYRFKLTLFHCVSSGTCLWTPLCVRGSICFTEACLTFLWTMLTRFGMRGFCCFFIDLDPPSPPPQPTDEMFELAFQFRKTKMLRWCFE